MSDPAFPLDLEQMGYAYLERPNAVLIDLLGRHLLDTRPQSRVVDIGCGAGTIGRAVKQRWPQVYYGGVEPEEQAVALARQVLNDCFAGSVDAWAKQPMATWDAVILSDVLEHQADPVRFLRTLTQCEATRGALFVVSVPNYAIWYNRLNGLVGRFRYSWSGLYDRTHLRFFTRTSFHELLRYCGFSLQAEQCTPGLVQAAAPLLRKLFRSEVARHEHRALADSVAYEAYQRLVEPIEGWACRGWPELLGFQFVAVARVGRA